jgi:hypothetical protein
MTDGHWKVVDTGGWHRRVRDGALPGESSAGRLPMRPGVANEEATS